MTLLRCVNPRWRMSGRSLPEGRRYGANRAGLEASRT